MLIETARQQSLDMIKKFFGKVGHFQNLPHDHSSGKMLGNTPARTLNFVFIALV
jgi:hypothetical protein